MNRLRIAALCAIVSVGLVSTGQGNLIAEWNELHLEAIRTETLSPLLAARNLAIVHAAIYDAVNAVDRKYTAYRVELIAPTNTSDPWTGGRGGDSFLAGKRWSQHDSAVHSKQ